MVIKKANKISKPKNREREAIVTQFWSWFDQIASKIEYLRTPCEWNMFRSWPGWVVRNADASVWTQFPLAGREVSPSQTPVANLDFNTVLKYVPARFQGWRCAKSHPPKDKINLSHHYPHQTADLFHSLNGVLNYCYARHCRDNPASLVSHGHSKVNCTTEHFSNNTTNNIYHYSPHYLYRTTTYIPSNLLNHTLHLTFINKYTHYHSK